MFIFAILSVFVFGWLITGLINKTGFFAERLGLSFLLGLQFLTLALFVLNIFFGVHLDLTSSWLVMLILILAILPFSLHRAHFKPPDIKLTGSARQKMLLVILIILTGSSLVISFWHPIIDWDAVTMFDYRAKIILDTGWIKDTLIRDSIVAYPLFTTLSHYWLEVNRIPTAMPLYPLLYGSFILVSYSLLRRMLSVNWALTGTLFLATAPKMFDQSLVAYANLPYTINLLSGAAYLYFWTKSHQKSDLILGIILSLLSLWVRSFPFAIANIISVLLLYPKTRKITIISGCIIGLAVTGYFFWPVDIQRLAATLDFTEWAVFNYYFPYTWIFIAFMGYSLFNRSKNNYWLMTIIFYFLIYISGNYYYSGINPYFAAIPDAAQRMMMFLSPAILLAFYFYAADNSKIVK